MTTKKNSFLFKIKVLDDKDDFNTNNFIDLFLDDGVFQPYLDEIFGIAIRTIIKKIFIMLLLKTQSLKKSEKTYAIRFANWKLFLLRLTLTFQYKSTYPRVFDNSSLFTQCHLIFLMRISKK